MKIYHLQWERANRDKVVGYAAKADPELRRLRSRRYAAKNKKRIAEKYMRDRKSVLARVAQYAQDFPDKVRQHKRNYKARKKGARGTVTVEEIAVLYKRQRGKCANCGKSLKLGYHADHRMPLKLGGANDIANIDLLCPHCNHSKQAKHPAEWALENGRLI